MRLYDTNIGGYRPLIAPCLLRENLPTSERAQETVLRARREIQDILTGKDLRKIIIAGPCSIHDPAAALEYAGKLKMLAERVEDRFCVVMRTYFEKPRTTIGWKGLINDPHLNGSFAIEDGLHIARKLLLDIAELGLATGTEMLDPITPQYIADLISWTSIGARTTESQTHRQMASGLSMPIGFKNGTGGEIGVAIDALKACGEPHSFLGIDEKGTVCVCATKGNPYGHIVLRGGIEPNYELVDQVREQLYKRSLRGNVIVDCSHGNSNKEPARQKTVFDEVLKGNAIGAMLESHLLGGKQKIPSDLHGFDPSSLQYGISVTDACMGWDETERLLLGDL